MYTVNSSTQEVVEGTINYSAQMFIWCIAEQGLEYQYSWSVLYAFKSFMENAIQ